MSCATHIKRINPVSGATVVIDLATGQVETDAAKIAALQCCPERKTDKEKICLQPIGNTDPANIDGGWMVSVEEIYADGTATVLSTKLWDLARANDMTTTHEAVTCPDTTPIDVALCLPAA